MNSQNAFSKRLQTVPKYAQNQDALWLSAWVSMLCVVLIFGVCWRYGREWGWGWGQANCGCQGAASSLPVFINDLTATETETNSSTFNLVWTQSSSQVPEFTFFGAVDGIQLFNEQHDVVAHFSNPAIVVALNDGSKLFAGTAQLNLYMPNAIAEPNNNTCRIRATLGTQHSDVLVQSIACVDAKTRILTTRGILAASQIMMQDGFVQLDGRVSRVVRVEAMQAPQAMLYMLRADVLRFASAAAALDQGCAALTFWHPVRMPDEHVYVPAGTHPMFVAANVAPSNGFVYNFQLESFEDDFLFAASACVAESLNDLPHGVPLVRHRMVLT